MLWRARCSRRLLLETAHDRSGRIYFYYRCAGISREPAICPVSPSSRWKTQSQLISPPSPLILLSATKSVGSWSSRFPDTLQIPELPALTCRSKAGPLTEPGLCRVHCAHNRRTCFSILLTSDAWFAYAAIAPANIFFCEHQADPAWCSLFLAPRKDRGRLI
jgi:hypothetical protein